MTEDEMVGWHHRLNGHEFEEALGVGDGQGSLGSQRVGHNCATELNHHQCIDKILIGKTLQHSHWVC